MMKNCVTRCATYHNSLKKMYHTSPEPHLYLRNNIFYCRIELPSINKRRKFIRFSLGTANYYEARQMIQDIEKINKLFSELKELYEQLNIQHRFIQNDTPSSNQVQRVDVLDENSDKELLKNFIAAYDRCYNIKLDKIISYIEIHIKDCNYTLTNAGTSQEYLEDKRDLQKRINFLKTYMLSMEEYKNICKSAEAVIIQAQNILNFSNALVSHQGGKQNIVEEPNYKEFEVPHHTIQEVIERMKIDLKHNMSEYEITRKQQDIANALGTVEIELSNDYNKINNQKMINQIEANIKNDDNIKAKTTNRKLRSIRYLIESAHKLEPEYYIVHNISLLSEKRSIATKERKEYLPYSKDELIKIFDINNPVFKKYPDIFWACMIALFCGARTNGATTLRYDDIVTKDNIPCFDFKITEEDEEVDIKKLKTSATVRKVPIHSKLIELGFLDYIKRHKKKNKDNFIFSRALTKENTYNRHFMRPLFAYLEKIGIKKDRWKSFHSFRTNINKALRDCGVDETFRNDIVGWEGKTTTDRHYSTNSLTEIQEQLEKLTYDFLDPYLEEWQETMKNK